MVIDLTILDTLHKLLLPGESVSLFSQELKKLLDHVMHEMSERWDNRTLNTDGRLLSDATIGQTDQHFKYSHSYLHTIYHGARSIMST